MAWKRWRSFHSLVQARQPFTLYSSQRSKHSIRHGFARIVSRISLCFLHTRTYPHATKERYRDRQRSISIYVFTRICLHATYAWMHAYTHASVHTHTYTYIFIYIHIDILSTLPRGIPTALWSPDCQIHKRRFLYDAFKSIYIYIM